ncbi:MAG: alpha/beta hydrolase [Proteobacteria bacterium]|nr:alpha/beta hydrolase [Pseudomonadota bacterium]
MRDLADLFPGFAAKYIDGEAGTIFARVGGEANDREPIVLLHGFPQTHVMWHHIAPELAKTRQVIAMDLRGYGWSSAPRSDARHETYSKRAMALDVIKVIESVGAVRADVVGHDRGARVAYRLAMEHPGRVSRLALLDIIPTIAMWERMDAKRAMQVYHWSFLAQPEPMPETMISKAPTEWLEHTLASWTRDKDLSAFGRDALAHYRAFFNDPSRIHATCEDYRAGATRDAEADEEARAKGLKITCPTLILWGEAGIPAAGSTPLDAWKEFAPDAEGYGIDAGHFLAEENAPATLEALQEFLA